MRAIGGSGPSRIGTFRQASAEAIEEFVTRARLLSTEA
jgi:hypothetical protein